MSCELCAALRMKVLCTEITYGKENLPPSLAKYFTISSSTSVVQQIKTAQQTVK